MYNHNKAREAFNSSDSYYNRTKQFELLSHQEHCELINRVKQGDEEAKTKMIKANLRLVISVAKTYPAKGFDIEDLIQEGNLGLIRAVEKFEPEKGFQFSTYASTWIRHFIGRMLNEKSTLVALPGQIKAVIYSIERAETELLIELKRQPTRREISERLDMEIEEIEKYEIYRKSISSLDKNYSQTGEATLPDILMNDDHIEQEETVFKQSLKEYLSNCLEDLDDREQKIIKMRFGLEGGPAYGLKEIGLEIGLSRERVRQIEVKILKKLRDHEDIKALQNYIK